MTRASGGLWLSSACAAIFACAVMVARTAVGHAAESGPFPAAVSVAVDHTYLHAGPGEDFYPTERLPVGTALEAWAVDASGYVAVRPVAGSYSWLRAADVDMQLEPVGAAPAAGSAGDRCVGVIVTDGAVSRVGSQINDLRHVAQVTLEAGERVQVLEEVRVDAGRHAGLWVRIEPPAGEFRWARLADLEVPPEVAALAPQPALAADSAAPPAAASIGEALTAIKEAGVAVAQAVREPEQPPVATSAAVGLVPAPAAPVAPVAPPQPLGFMPQAKRLFAGWLPKGTSVFDPAAPVAPVAVTAGTLGADELADVDLALSLAVTGPTESWNLAPVRERLRQIAARATTDGDRTRVEAVDARIARFEAIQSRHKTLAAATAPAAAVPAADSSLQLGGMWSSLSAIGNRPIRPGVLPGGGPADGQPSWTPPDLTETTGRLATVVSRRPDAPRWAVVDQSNNVIAFVTPQTGVNLAPLVGQEVAVRGARGYMPEYKRPYVVASEARVRIAAAPEASPDRATR